MSDHMSPDEFRKWGRRVVDWVADYWESLESRPVLSSVEPGEIRSSLPDSAPEKGESIDAILSDLDEKIMPGVTHWQHPNFFAYFPANNSGPSVLGELLSAGLGVQGMLWATSPACTELETHVLDWLVEALDLPDRFRSTGEGGGVIQDTASSASLCALLAARERVSGFRTRKEGNPTGLVAYASSDAHSSIEKAMSISGLGSSQLRLLPGRAGAIDGAGLDRAIAADVEAGKTPFLIVASIGTTSSNGFDSLEELGEIAGKHRLWLHADAAMSGTAALCPELRGMHRGLELADSYCFNPHKWMLTNFDCDCFYVADREALVRALSILPEYLKNTATEAGQVIDYRDWQVPLGRRFRALKLWMVVRYYGLEGLRAHVRRHVEWTARLREKIDANPQFEALAPSPLNLVCFRHIEGDERTAAILADVNRSGEMYLTHTRIEGQYALRMAIGATRTEWRHVEAAWETLARAGQQQEG